MVLWSHWQCKEPGNPFPCLTPSLLQHSTNEELSSRAEDEEGLRNPRDSLAAGAQRAMPAGRARERRAEGNQG